MPLDWFFGFALKERWVYVRRTWIYARAEGPLGAVHTESESDTSKTSSASGGSI
jgi:hypothetical protein